MSSARLHPLYSKSTVLNTPHMKKDGSTIGIASQLPFAGTTACLSWSCCMAFNWAQTPWKLEATSLQCRFSSWMFLGTECLKQLCATNNCTHKPLRGPCIETYGTTGILKALGRSHGVSHPQHPTTTAQHLPTQPTRLPTQLLRSPRCLGDCTIINATEQRDAGHAGRVGNGTGCEETK